MTTGWISVLSMAVICLPCGGQSKPQTHFPLTATQVAQSLSSSGNKVTEEQVSLLANVVAMEPNPALDIVSAAPFSDPSTGQRPESRSLVKLACRRPGICLPFYAVVSWPEGTVGHITGSANALVGLDKAMQKASSAFTIRAGAHATMVMGDDRTHIQVAVISLENGVVGHKIRVASPDHKQIYVAEVVNANLLKGSF